MSKFRDDLNKAYQKKVIGGIETAVRKVVFTLDQILQLTTPVLTGRAKANWLPSLNAPRRDTVEPDQKPEVGLTLSAYKIKDTVFISNNLPYIRRLNDGYSKKAPAGFVDDAVMNAKRAVK